MASAGPGTSRLQPLSSSCQPAINERIIDDPPSRRQSFPPGSFAPLLLQYPRGYNGLALTSPLEVEMVDAQRTQYGRVSTAENLGPVNPLLRRRVALAVHVPVMEEVLDFTGVVSCSRSTIVLPNGSGAHVAGSRDYRR